MRHLESERWSRGSSVLHSLDARAKLITVVAVLAFIGTAHAWNAQHFLFYAALAGIAVTASRLPVAGLLRRVAVILPFTFTFSLAAWFSSGDLTRAATLLSRSAVSAVFVILLSGVTSMPALLDAAGRLGAPRVLTTITQFLYRYLFLLLEQAVRVRQAALCRGGLRWDASAGAAAALFTASEERAERIHQAMLARGFAGRFLTLDPPRWRAADTCLVAATGLLLSAGRILWGF